MVEVKAGCGSTAHWSILFIRLNRWLRHCFALLNTDLEIDGIGQNWEDSNSASVVAKALRVCSRVRAVVFRSVHLLHPHCMMTKAVLVRWDLGQGFAVMTERAEDGGGDD